MIRLLTVVGLQLFWLSFVVIGAAALLVLRRVCGRKYRFIGYLGTTHPLVVLLIATGCGMVFFAPLLVPAYLLQWPLAVLAWVYVVVLAAAIAWLSWHWRMGWRWVCACKRRTSLSGWLWFGAVGSILLADAIAATRVGGPMISDAFVHMAKINSLIEGGKFTLADPILGNGVTETRYHINLILSLNALAGYILHVPAIDVWRYSLAFWRCLVWVSMFMLCWEFVSEKLRRRWSYVTLMVVPVLYSTMFFCADYPDRAVFAWVALLVVGLKLLLEHRTALILLLAAMLITFTHPLMSTIAGGFLLLVVIVLWPLRMLRRKQIIAIITSDAVLALSVIYTNLFPNRMGTSVKDAVLQLQLRHFGPITLALPAHADPHIWWLWLPLLTAAIGGCVYVIICARSKALKVMLFLLFIYYQLIVLNPVLLAVVAGHVPAWVLNRFQEMNVLRLVTPIIGLLAFVEWCTKHLKRRWPTYALTTAIAVGLLWYGSPTAQHFLSMNSGFEQNYATYMDLKGLAPELRSQHVFTDVNFHSQMLPVVMQTNVLWITEENASPMANIDRRWQCANSQLAGSLLASDLQAAGITILTNNTTDPWFAQRTAADPQFTLMTKTGPYAVYRVPPPAKAPKATTICFIPYGQ